MSDAGVPDALDGSQLPTSTNALTAGAMMRRAREAAGLHVAALAVSMKIPVKKLEALEADRLELLHDAVFVRALAASVCRALKIDPVPILVKLPMNAAPSLKSAERGINAPFHSPSDVIGTSLPGLLTKPSTLIFFALVLAGIVVFFLPDAKVPDLSGDSANPVTVTTDNAAPLLMTQPAIPATNAFPETLSPAQVAPQTTNDIATMQPADAVPRVQSGTSAAPAVVASQITISAGLPQNVANGSSLAGNVPLVAASRPSSAPVLTSTGTVVFKAKGATWVKVVDAKGLVQLSKTLSGGEVVGASGVMPLSVVVGRVDATDVEVRGQAFNLLGVSRDNVARFEVK